MKKSFQRCSKDFGLKNKTFYAERFAPNHLHSLDTSNDVNLVAQRPVIFMGPGVTSLNKNKNPMLHSSSHRFAGL